MSFQFDPETRRKLGYQLIDALNDYFSSLPDRNVQLPLDDRTFGALTDKMPELGENAEAVLREATSELIDKGFHVPSANYFGLMNPAPTYMAVLAEALVAALNPQLATLARSQLASKIEAETVRWIAERVGWKKVGAGEGPCQGARACDGTFTSGGNEANFSALALALAAYFPDSVENGVASIGAQPIIYASSESHHSLDKSAGLLGLGRKALRRIPVDERAMIAVDRLERTILEDRAAGKEPFCIVATAGTTNSGAVDDIVALAAIAKKHDLWLHVDGAYGAAAIFSDKHRDLVRGIEQADSITIDPHKWLSMPFAAGVVLTSRPDMLERAFAVVTPYMPRIDNPNLIDNFKVSAQWSRRMNSLKLWLTLRVHGRQAYEELIDRQMQLAAKMAAWFRNSNDFELAVEPKLTILNFRLKLDLPEAELAAAHKALIDEITREGKLWISHTNVAGRSVCRMMIISYFTDEHNLEQLQESLMKAAGKIRQSVLSGQHSVK
ncbi:MAG TPA: pyridoxal-dependent decarboxylase [Terriglobales bacterium]|nr:pyridoxal-dependent decarboxylase [Terriglobales bacterium]